MTTASIVVEFDKLRAELDAVLAEVHGVARTATTTTTIAWGAIVQAMTGEPTAGLPPAGEAANPAEVRSVLLAVCRRYEQRLVPIERAIKAHDVGDELEDAVWNFRHRRLDRLVNEEVETYIKTVTPKPSVASVFAKAANVARASAPVALATNARAQLHRCVTCGAPRLGESLYGNCLYCGHPFFTGREEIT
jgi:hypothetical protein